MKWLESLLTDRQGEPDTGRLLVVVVILGMIGLQGYDVIHSAREFKPESFGLGVAGVLGGFAAYLIGDRPTPPPTAKRK